MNCQRGILGMHWFHFVTNASVTSQTGEEDMAFRIRRKQLSVFGHVRRLPEATPGRGHSSRLQTRQQTGVETPTRTTLPSVDAAD